MKTKTAEDILAAKLNLDSSWTHSNGITPKSLALCEAMQEYADQFKTKWIPVKELLPDENKMIIFKLNNNDRRMGYFVLNDQWNRPNIFCDGSFHKSESIKGWYYVID